MLSLNLETLLLGYVIYLSRSALGDSFSLCLRGLRDTEYAREALVWHFGYVPRADWGQRTTDKLTWRGFEFVTRTVENREHTLVTWNPIKARLNLVASPDRCTLRYLFVEQLVGFCGVSLAFCYMISALPAITSTPQSPLVFAVYIASGTCWFGELRLLCRHWIAYTQSVKLPHAVSARN